MQPHEILRAAADIVEADGGWCPGPIDAQDATGRAVPHHQRKTIADFARVVEQAGILERDAGRAPKMLAAMLHKRASDR
jgi:hypothetical protein